MGFPGVLPVLNKKVVEFAIRAGLATHCEIARASRWARKNYFYPDLPKGYQISQYELPVCERGFLEIEIGGARKKIRLTRIHMEEDAGKNIHDARGDYSLVDLNRAGVPLLEIVSEPDLQSAEEATAYLKNLRGILQYLEICDGNMEEGSFRCDANVPAPAGSRTLGTKSRSESNSFKAVEKAIASEIERQVEMLAEGGKLARDAALGLRPRVTRSMRSKSSLQTTATSRSRFLPLTSTKKIAGFKRHCRSSPRAKQRFAVRIRLRPMMRRSSPAAGTLRTTFEAAVRSTPIPRPSATG